MKRSNRLVLLIGIFLAIVAFVLVIIFLRDDKTGTGHTRSWTSPVVVAAKDVPLGAKLTADSVTTKMVKQTDKQADSFADTSQVIGQTARQAVTSGQLITSVTIGQTSTTGLTTIDCPATLVCMAVQVDQVSGVGTLIQAGDHVDMVIALTGDRFPVVTINPTDESVTVVAGVNGTSTKMVLQGMQVVGTLLPPPPAQNGNNAQASPGTTETTLNGQQELVILAVTPQQSEVIKFSQVDASITLVLRSADDFRDAVTGEPLPPETIIPVTTTGVTLKTMVDDYGVLVPELVEAILPAQSPKP